MNSSALADLEPVVGKLLDRHLDSAREWFPHELVPWERGSRIEPGKPWEPPAGTPISEGVRSAILVNLLTEDNLPYYTVALASAFGTAGAWGDWMRRWTAEEGRHSIVLRDCAERCASEEAIASGAGTDRTQPGGRSRAIARYRRR